MRFSPQALAGPLAAGLLVIASAAPLAADRCEIGVEPAATLLLPYFEVDPDDPSGVTTLLSVSNARSTPALLNVTFWTDWGVPSFNFPIYLTGYDVVTMNIGLTLREGYLPITAHLDTDPADTISPHGFPGWDSSFEACDPFLPLTSPGQPTIPPFLIERIQRFHSGQPDDTGATPNVCSGQDHGDGKLRGYVTIDNVNRCDLLYPSEDGYFADGGTGVANNENQLFGDFYLLDPSRGYAQGDSLVHIQAYDGVGEDGAWQDGDETFYGRYVGRSAIDNREPLPNVFGARYLGELGGGGGTDLLVWRDTMSSQSAAVECGTMPSWYPLTEYDVLEIDEEENWAEACSLWGYQTPPDGSGTPEKLTPPPAPGTFDCFRIATQRIGVAGENLDEDLILGAHDSGWLRIDFRPSASSQLGQAWVVAMLSSGGQYSIGLPAAALYSPCDDELPPYDPLEPYDAPAP